VADGVGVVPVAGVPDGVTMGSVVVGGGGVVAIASAEPDGTVAGPVQENVSATRRSVTARTIRAMT
jgi:hypothetical protein